MSESLRDETRDLRRDGHIHRLSMLRSSAKHPTLALALILSSGCGEAKYMGPAVPASPQASTTSASVESVTELERRVLAIEKQRTPQPRSTSGEESAGWSCAALCVTKYHCTANGDSNVTFNRLESTAATPLAAFKNLTSQCAKDDDLEVHAQCKGGQFDETDATLVNACVKN